mgnify:CR=1 FL=1
MSKKIFKNSQVNVGGNFKVKVPMKMLIKQDTKSEEIISALNEGDFEDDFENEEDSKNFISKIKTEAIKIIEEAQASAENLKSEIINEAKKQGYQEGKAEAEKQYLQSVNESIRMKEKAHSEYTKMIKDAEKDILQMIFDICRKIIGKEISQDKDIIISLIKQAYAQATNKDSVIIKVSSQDYEFLMSNRDKLILSEEAEENINIKKDYDLKPGACILEYPFGIIDTGVETRLRKIEEAFLESIRDVHD